MRFVICSPAHIYVISARHGIDRGLNCRVGIPVRTGASPVRSRIIPARAICAKRLIDIDVCSFRFFGNTKKAEKNNQKKYFVNLLFHFGLLLNKIFAIDVLCPVAFFIEGLY